MPIHATVTTLPQRLHIVSISKHSLQKFTHPLLNILFYSNREEFFITYTEVLDEISIVLDENLWHMLKSHPIVKENSSALHVSDKIWSAFKFSISSPPAETKGFINAVAAPLSHAGISIFYLYTFNTDYILFEESNASKAKECLKENFKVVSLDEDNEQSIYLSAVELPPSKPVNVLENFSQLQVLQDISVAPASISREKMSDISFDIIELIFFPKDINQRRFISYSSEGDEISLLLDERTLIGFSGKQKLSLILPERWIPIKRVKKHGFFEIGVVSALSAPLRDISILYLSTYASANILVRKEDLQFCVEKLRESQFHVSLSPNS